MSVLRVGLAGNSRRWEISLFGMQLVNITLPSNELPPFHWHYIGRRSGPFEWLWIQLDGVFLYVFNFVWRLRGKLAP